MYTIAHDTKSFMKPEYAAIQSSAMTDSYKWATADVLPETKTIFNTVDPDTRIP